MEHVGKGVIMPVLLLDGSFVVECCLSGTVFWAF